MPLGLKPFRSRTGGHGPADAKRSKWAASLELRDYNSVPYRRLIQELVVFGEYATASVQPGSSGSSSIANSYFSGDGLATDIIVDVPVKVSTGTANMPVVYAGTWLIESFECMDEQNGKSTVTFSLKQTGDWEYRNESGTWVTATTLPWETE